MKAACGKTARAVWAADGGQRLRARLLRPDRFDDRTEGLNVKLGLETQVSLIAKDAESRAAMLETHPEGSRRNRREEGLGASTVTARRASLVRGWRAGANGRGRLDNDCCAGALCAS